MKCELRVNPRNTKDARSICGSAGRFYTVAGGVGKLVLYACTRHRAKLEKIGLSVIPVTPLEASAFQKARAETIDDEELRASHCVSELTKIAGERRHHADYLREQRAKK